MALWRVVRSLRDEASADVWLDAIEMSPILMAVSPMGPPLRAASASLIWPDRELSVALIAPVSLPVAMTFGGTRLLATRSQLRSSAAGRPGEPISKDAESR